MKILSNISRLFLVALLLGATLISCKNKDAATETETTETTVEAPMDTVSPVPAEEVPMTSDTTTTTETATPAATGTTTAK